ncbi:sialate O-acetylesterase [Flavisolibacter nicotianae]|uniref:sialate O-acetylesterase n=1 Tax=Flavisolibacter nicotianae TaxID=2364882 RepID=UPI000EB212F8|nr:sialate O-acetylesterase [Flavisolibacter nicotianae]
MMRFFFSVLSLCVLSTADAQVRLPRLLRDSMVLQRDTKVKVWGWAAPGEKVQVTFNKKTYKTTTAADGKWSLFIQPTKAGGPYTLNIDGSNHITLKDVLAGDVWVCAGQSNMVHQMSLHSVRYADEIAKANYPQIRQFWVPNITALQGPQEDLPSGSWKAANPKDVLDFSAVAYFFAKSLYEKYGVPIGIINASWGGVPIEAMMSEASLKEFPNILSTVEKNKDTAYVNGTNRKTALAARPPRGEDKGMTSAKPWHDPTYEPKGWRPINIPGYWEDQGIKDLDGVVWYRREIDVPASMTNTQAKVFLGRIVDADALYINGKQVGNTGYMYPQRRYTVPAGLLKPGKNLFVVRVTNNGGKGGFVPDKPYQLFAGNDTVDLKGEWHYKVGQVFTPQRSFVPGIALQNQPASLYNAMVAPLTSYTVKGFNWYQGESNAGRPEEYARLQPAMIQDWLQKWNAPTAPFFFVQLPGFMEMSYLPTESSWAAFREAQTKSLSLPNTGMAVAIDLGEWNDIHPDRKKEVGERLALQAMKVAYGEKALVAGGPLYQSAQKDGARIILSFTNVGSGLITNDGEELSEFAIAGADKKFVWAKAKIEGDKIIVWNDEVQNPVHVRYAWADNPVNPNLYNKEGLPASPFGATVNP